MIRLLRDRIGAAALIASLCVPTLSHAASMTVSSFDGSVTNEELQSFNKYIAGLQPAADNIGNNWAQGHSGEETKAMGLVYQIAGQQETLDNMLRYCDAVLSERNDIAPAPTGQHRIWTGDIAPAWPNNVTGKLIATGGEQGDPVGHLANCANLILGNKTLHNQTVGSGDKHGHGRTYFERAQTYVAQADKAMANHVLSRLLDLSKGSRMYFAKDSPYKGGEPVPWNQQMMFNYAFQNLVASHSILGDNPNGLATKYKTIMTASLDWFFLSGGSQTKKSKQGNPIYVWDYAVGAGVEDSNHASLDVAGFHRAFADGHWKITPDQMKPFANLLVDVMTLAKGKYAGTVDGRCVAGHSACTNYIRSGFLLLSEFRPDQYRAIVGADLQQGGTTGKIDIFSRFLWAKNRRAKGL